jgi:bud site selection protein 20
MFLWVLAMLIFHRVKALKDGPYTQKEAEAAIGLRTDNGPRQAAKENTKDVGVDMENSGLLEDVAT